jgi:hypothetical protein
MVVAAGREERRLLPDARLLLEPEDISPEAEGTLQISHLEVDMADGDARINRGACHGATLLPGRGLLEAVAGRFPFALKAAAQRSAYVAMGLSGPSSRSHEPTSIGISRSVLESSRRISSSRVVPMVDAVSSR